MRRHDKRDFVRRRIVSLEHSANYALRLWFDDGREQEINLEPILHGPIFGALRDPTVFCQAQLDPGFGALVWPNGADLEPMVLYDWMEYVDGIVARRHLSKPTASISHQTKL